MEIQTPEIPVNPAPHRGRARKTQEQDNRVADFLAGCTIEERALAVRLVRLLRDNYWVSELVRQILRMEAENPDHLTIKQLRDLLDSFETLEALASNAQKLGNAWSNHPILRAIRDEWEEIQDYKSNRKIEQLIETAHKR